MLHKLIYMVYISCLVPFGSSLTECLQMLSCSCLWSYDWSRHGHRTFPSFESISDYLFVVCWFWCLYLTEVLMITCCGVLAEYPGCACWIKTDRVLFAELSGCFRCPTGVCLLNCLGVLTDRQGCACWVVWECLLELGGKSVADRLTVGVGNEQVVFNILHHVADDLAAKPVKYVTRKSVSALVSPCFKFGRAIYFRLSAEYTSVTPPWRLPPRLSGSS